MIWSLEIQVCLGFISKSAGIPRNSTGFGIALVGRQASAGSAFPRFGEFEQKFAQQTVDRCAPEKGRGRKTLPFASITWSRFNGSAATRCAALSAFSVGHQVRLRL